MNKYMDDTPISVTPRLHEILKKRGMTQQELAEKSGVSQGTISRFDKSSKHVDWHLFAIADALNIEISELFRVEKKNK